MLPTSSCFRLSVPTRRPIDHGVIVAKLPTPGNIVHDSEVYAFDLLTIRIVSDNVSGRALRLYQDWPLLHSAQVSPDRCNHPCPRLILDTDLHSTPKQRQP